MTIKGYSTFLNISINGTSHVVWCHIKIPRWRKVWPHCKDAFGVFYSLSRQSWNLTMFHCNHNNIFNVSLHFYLPFSTDCGLWFSQGFLRINFFIFFYCGLFVLILVVFVLFLLSIRFGQISPLAFFGWFTATSDRNAESCNRIPVNYCLP